MVAQKAGALEVGVDSRLEVTQTAGLANLQQPRDGASNNAMHSGTRAPPLRAVRSARSALLTRQK
jgi:hypothetical protein